MPLRFAQRPGVVYHDLGYREAGQRILISTDRPAEVRLERDFAGKPWNLHVAVQLLEDGMPAKPVEYILISSAHWRIRGSTDGLTDDKLSLKVVVG